MFINIQYIKNGFLITLEGNVTIEDIKRANKEMFNHMHYENIEFYIWDYRKVESVNVLSSEISLINAKASQKRKILRPIKVALVADKPFTYGMSRMFSSLSENSYWAFEVFKTMEEAEEWVNTEDKSSASSQI